MTVTEFVTYVRNIHNAISDTNWSDSEIFRLLQAKANEVVSIIGLIETKDETITTVIGTQSYSYPTNIIRMRRVLFDGRGLKLITFRQWESRTPTGTQANGLPREYVLWNNQIILVPPPSTAKTLTLYGEKQQSDITGTGSTIDIPAVLHSALADGVIMMMFTKDLNLAHAGFYRDLWINVHIPAMQIYGRRRRRTGNALIVGDADSLLETDFGLI